MGFFSDLKEDLSQAVNELMPEEELDAVLAADENTQEKTLADDSAVLPDVPEEKANREDTALPEEDFDLSSMLDKLGVSLPLQHSMAILASDIHSH